MSEPSDVTLDTVVVAYDRIKDNWVLSVSGQWNDLSGIDDEIGAWWPAIGSQKNIGGLDAVGIVLYNTSGQTPTLLSSAGYVNDGQSEYMTISNPSTYDSRKGIIFQYQDKVTCTRIHSLTSIEYDYLGKGFSTTMRFDSSFAQFHGKARGYFAHTWNETTITGASFSSGDAAFGVSLTWSENKDHFDIYSSADTNF